MEKNSYSVTLSMRGKFFTEDIEEYISTYFPAVPVHKVDSVFGFVEKSSLYGGRPFQEAELSDNDIEKMIDMGIGLRLPLTNSYVTREEYEENLPMLEKYHRDGNSVITVNDELANWIREDFPKYHIEASVIKNINSLKKLELADKVYDTIVLPAKLSDDYAFLSTIENKSKIRLFANAGCAYNCESKTCYVSISKMNKDPDAPFLCSKTVVPRKELGMVDFDIKRLRALGFNRFKLLRGAGITGL